MQEQRFTLATGDLASISPGVLRMTYLDTGEVDDIELADLRNVKRDGTSVRLAFRGHALTLDAVNMSDAGRIESLLVGDRRETRTRATENATERRKFGELWALRLVLVIVAVILLVAYFV